MSDDPAQFMSELDEPGMERVLPRAVTAPGSPRGRAATAASVIGRAGLVIVVLAAGGAAVVAHRSRRRHPDGSPVGIPVAPA